jgi:hypothetical protein
VDAGAPTAGCDEHVAVVVERHVEAEELRGNGVDVAVLLDRGLEHPDHREEHRDGQGRQQHHLEDRATAASAAGDRWRVAGGPGHGDGLVDRDRHHPSLSLLR